MHHCALSSLSIYDTDNTELDFIETNLTTCNARLLKLYPVKLIIVFRIFVVLLHK